MIDIVIISVFRLLFSCWYFHRLNTRDRREVDAFVRAEASRENAVARRQALKVRNDEKHRVFGCQKDNPETWPFKARSEDKKAVCWHHGAAICPFCCMDFTIINRLRKNKEYLRNGSESKRLSIVESAIAEYYERVKKLPQNPAMKHSPFMTALENSLTEDDYFRRIALASMHCYDARSSSSYTPSSMAQEIDWLSRLWRKWLSLRLRAVL